jgi:hypothetical protein
LKLLQGNSKTLEKAPLRKFISTLNEVRGKTADGKKKKLVRADSNKMKEKFGRGVA